MFRLIGKLMQFITGLLLLVLAAGVLIFVYARFVEPRLLQVREQTIVSGTVSDACDGLRIVQFSDVHVCDDDDPGKLMRLVENINAQDADIVVFTGDLFDNFPAYTGDPQSVADSFSQIRAKQGKYAVLGNHDYEISALPVVQKIWEDAGFTLLKDESVRHDSLDLTIVGMDDWLFGSCETTCLEKADPDGFTLLLCHEPDVARELDASGFDLMLSGHTHGGQVQLPFIGIIYTPPLGRIYEEGLFDLGGSRDAKLYVNRGVGQSLLPVRLLVPPELTVFTLRQK